ncbi:TPA: LPXTG cell wall anchor domain-containing protein [Clostridium perfringens]|uniref:LPXTG cell wall anchor domain-containing protein n=2 Tax=Bacteria TaxID=2 RepID=UPI001CB2D921|nr:LPXTG cell wall anchor domain-containing protein [Staphylococcus pasteuri]MCR0853286.1 LPXTG cell wall anchor domain-containing protein [Staphylococcus aureus]MEB6613493.1 LPXTG cell wall anchor domain-containing protein [Staphylococcus pasteuri]HBI7123610.1 LPXTG cell wall anchor domain-containing protein [Clostridium perfringens]
MNKLSLLGTTTLAGTLLFAGIGHPNAHAASEVNQNNAVDMIKKIDQSKGNDPSLIRYGQPEDKGDYYEVTTNNKSGVGGAGITRIYQDGTVKHKDGSSSDAFKTMGQYDLDTSSNATPSDQPTVSDNQTTKNVTQSSSTSNHANHTSQATLPETGQTDTHTPIVFGLMLLVTGGLILVRRSTQKH